MLCQELALTRLSKGSEKVSVFCRLRGLMDGGGLSVLSPHIASSLSVMRRDQPGIELPPATMQLRMDAFLTWQRVVEVDRRCLCGF